MSHRDSTPASAEFLETLRDAHARQPYPKPVGRYAPKSLTVAISREAGSRGGTIAVRAGRKLSWQVYDQELLEYLAHERHLNQDLFQMLDPLALEWVEEQLQALLKHQHIAQHRSLVELARVVLAIGARGEAVIIGRGAGCMLPPESTVHVRIVAPLADRIAYMSQLERLTRDQVYQYDAVLNSSLLGEDLSAELIARATQAKLANRQTAGSRSVA